MKQSNQVGRLHNRSLYSTLRWVIVLLGLLVAVTSATPFLSSHQTRSTLPYSAQRCLQQVPRGGGWIIPSGWNPFGYKITKLGEDFLQFGGSLDSDIGRILASLKKRKRWSTLKSDWLEVLRVSKSTQTMRIYRTLKDLLDFCLKAGLID